MSRWIYVRVKDWGENPPEHHCRYEPDLSQFTPSERDGIQIGEVRIPVDTQADSATRGRPVSNVCAVEILNDHDVQRIPIARRRKPTSAERAAFVRRYGSLQVERIDRDDDLDDERIAALEAEEAPRSEIR